MSNPVSRAARATAPVQADLVHLLAATPPHERRDVVVGFLRDEVARALGMSSAFDVDADQGLFEMGMDSLMSVELKGHIEIAAGRRLPSTLTFNYPTVNALAGFLLDELAADLPHDGTAATGSSQDVPDAGDPEPPPASTDDLSEDDLADLLSSRLAALRGNQP